VKSFREHISEGLKDPKDNPCWDGYKPVGTKKKNGKEVPNCVPANENFMDGRNPQDKGDMARHGLKGKSRTELRKIRSSPSASKRAKQLAHWSLNMHKEDLDESVWQRKEGQSETGGLNRKGIMAYRRENPGSKLSMAVTTPPSKLKKGSKAANRRKSFCARMSGVDGPMKKPNGEPTRKALALRKWNC
jgi:hypothetical protein